MLPLFRICWPYDADQPTNAANISWVHGAGYELFEVRSGDEGLLPIHRLGDKRVAGTVDAAREEFREVVRLARGDDGEKKREKAKWFAKEFVKGWEVGGEAYEQLKKLLNTVV